MTLLVAKQRLPGVVGAGRRANNICFPPSQISLSRGQRACRVVPKASPKKKEGEGGGWFEWWRSSDENNSKFGSKAAEKAYQNQLQMLENRRDKRKSQAREDAVRKRRAKVSRVMRGLEKEEEKKKKKEKAKKPLYDEPKNSIPIPLASFGIPEYDGGERFDLKGPYCDEGYVDEDADVMGKLFGFLKGKKKD